ncbi:MAG: hypothetical protein E6713_02930 [Sporomusaceae bacterium]|nr:hypothetical protein [Sporomusaceae bacterium]
MSVNDERLQAYLDAEKKALVSQEYQDGTQKNRRASLNQISEGVNSLLAAGAGIGGASASPGRSRRVVFRD